MVNKIEKIGVYFILEELKKMTKILCKDNRSQIRDINT